MTVSQLTGHSTNRLEILGEKGHLNVDLSAARPAKLDTARDGLAVMRLVEEAERAAETPAAPLVLERAG